MKGKVGFQLQLLVVSVGRPLAVWRKISEMEPAQTAAQPDSECAFRRLEGQEQYDPSVG